MGIAIICDICGKWSIEKEKGVLTPNEFHRDKWHPDGPNDFGRGDPDSMVCSNCAT